MVNTNYDPMMAAAVLLIITHTNSVMKTEQYMRTAGESYKENADKYVVNIVGRNRSRHVLLFAHKLLPNLVIK